MALVCDVYCDFVTFPCSTLGQVWYLFVSIPDPCCLPYYGILQLQRLNIFSKMNNKLRTILQKMYPGDHFQNSLNKFDLLVGRLK